MRSAIAIFSILALASGFIALRLIKERKQPLPVFGEVPSFEFVTSEEKSFTLDDLRGKVWVIDFIFTTCPGPCPMMGQQMARVHERFKNDPRVKLVSVSVNPAYDTPEILAQYAKRFSADPESWHFLHGPEEDVLALTVGGFKMGDPDDVIAHSQRFALVDTEGFVRGYYLGVDAASVDELMGDIKRLL